MFACDYCLALTDTFFKKPCPFYKQIENDPHMLVKVDGFPGTWRWVSGIGGNYLVSTRGEVMNHHKRVINPVLDSKGYPVVRLQYLQHYISIRVDDLVLRSFGKGSVGAIVHLDGNKLNCHIDNLARSK